MQTVCIRAKAWFEVNGRILQRDDQDLLPARSAELFEDYSRSTFLSRDHYAGKWVIPEEGDHNSLADINAAGREVQAPTRCLLSPTSSPRGM